MSGSRVRGAKCVRMEKRFGYEQQLHELRSVERIKTVSRSSEKQLSLKVGIPNLGVYPLRSRCVRGFRAQTFASIMESANNRRRENPLGLLRVQLATRGQERGE
ncbi:hypothetical protein FGB62_48g049 [Gracilaria domingensis]|nr:hypothetical protein FGB62_48g049 [Gracilaria domingensis]